MDRAAIILLVVLLFVKIHYTEFILMETLNLQQAALVEQQNVTIKREIHNSIKEVFAKPWP